MTRGGGPPPRICYVAFDGRVASMEPMVIPALLEALEALRLHVRIYEPRRRGHRGGPATLPAFTRFVSPLLRIGDGARRAQELNRTRGPLVTVYHRDPRADVVGGCFVTAERGSASVSDVAARDDAARGVAMAAAVALLSGSAVAARFEVDGARRFWAARGHEGEGPAWVMLGNAADADAATRMMLTPAEPYSPLLAGWRRACHEHCAYEWGTSAARLIGLRLDDPRADVEDGIERALQEAEFHTAQLVTAGGADACVESTVQALRALARRVSGQPRGAAYCS